MKLIIEQDEFPNIKDKTDVKHFFDFLKRAFMTECQSGEFPSHIEGKWVKWKFK